MAEEKDIEEDPSSIVDRSNNGGEKPSRPSFIGVGQEPPALVEELNNSNSPKDASELGSYGHKNNDSTTTSNQNEEERRSMAKYNSLGQLLPSPEPQARLAVARNEALDDQKVKERISTNSQTEPSAVGAFSVDNKPMESGNNLGPSAREARDSRYQNKMNASKTNTSNEDPNRRTSAGSQPGATHIREDAKQNLKSLVSHERVAQASQARYKNKMMQPERTETPPRDEQTRAAIQRVSGRGLRKNNKLTSSGNEEGGDGEEEVVDPGRDPGKPIISASPTQEEEKDKCNSERPGSSPSFSGGGDKQENAGSDRNPDNGFLVEATLVNEDSKRDILVAEAVEATPLFQKRYVCLLILLLVAVAGISVGITCGTISCSAKEETDATPTTAPSFAPTGAPTMAPSPYLIENLSPFTLEALQDPDSPQSRAYRWLRGYEETVLQNFTNDELLQKFALATFYYSTGGEDWNIREGWLSYEVHECDWYTGTDTNFYAEHNGNPCENKEYIYLTVWDNGLVGTIPPEIGLLSQLRVFDASDDSVSGTFPSTFWRLQNLRKMLVGNSRLSGTLPTELGSLTNLELIYLTGNSIVGTIPKELQQLSLLEELHLNQNRLERISSQIGLLPRLKLLDTSENILNSIPSELGQLTTLRYLFLFVNKISGTIPTEIGKLSLLENFDAGNNDMSGTVPSELGMLTKATVLSLGGPLGAGDFTGTLPTELGRLTQLADLWLNRIEVTGPIPSEFGMLSKLTYLELAWNLFTSPLPTELGLLENLQMLHAEVSQLNGAIPSEFGELTQLTKLDLSGNDLSGSLPTHLGLMTNLKHIILGYNEFTGGLPEELGNLTKLVGLGLEYLGSVNGTLPTELGQLSLLTELWLPGNELRGSIPSEFGLLLGLLTLDLNNNQLSSSLPSELLSLENLEQIYLAFNDITGNVEGLPFSSERLRILVLNGTSITGTVPTSLCGIAVFDCNGDQICGCGCER